MSQDELSLYLDALAREDCYRVVETLKSSDLETTEKVVLQRADGSQEGPFIRKRIRRDMGLGGAYERIYQAQQAGMHLDYIPRICEYYQRDDELVAVTEYVDGITLLELVYEQDPSVMLAAWVFPLLCDAVSELHEKFDPPIIHRDLKPSNVIVSNDRPVIIDFGIARNYDNMASSDTTQFGTRAYAPPEQYGYGQTNERSDIYALGMLLYFLLTEANPTPKTVQKRFKDADIPEPVRRVVERATAFDPNARYASVRELKRAFAEALLHAGSAKRAGTPESPSFEATPAFGAPTPASQGYPSMQAEAPAAPAYAAPMQPAPAQPAPQPVQAASSMPRYADQAPPAHSKVGDGKGFHTIGKVWNAILLGMLVISLGVSISLAFRTPVPMQNYPDWYNTIGYLFVVPSVLILACIALLDKRRIYARIPALGRLTRKQRVLRWFGALGVLFVVFFLLTIAAGG